MTPKSAFLILGLSFALLLEGCSGLFRSGEPEGFVKVQGSRFFLNDKPYYYAGTNVWYGCYLGSPGSTGNRERLCRELDSLKANGLVNLRILGASEDSYIKHSVKPAIQRKPGDLDEELLQGLDFLLAEMAKRRMHAVIFLNNYWEWSGGMVQYNVWANGGGEVDPENPAFGWGAFMDSSATFYANEKANALFKDYLHAIVTRRNTVNGRLYTEDPAIMAWQLANEPRPGREGELARRNTQNFYRWIEQTAHYLHGLDTNHLVSAGSEGLAGTLWLDTMYLTAHRPKEIDYLTLHLWPKNWGWFDPAHFEETLPSSESKALDYLNHHIGLARQLGKPIVMEEFGLARDTAACMPGSPATARDRFFALLFRTLYDSAKAGAPVGGSNFWAWGGEGKAEHPDHIWRPGDSFMGDPPQEPQGYNSVFNADRSTLAIIRQHAFQMLQLGQTDSLYAMKNR